MVKRILLLEKRERRRTTKIVKHSAGNQPKTTSKRPLAYSMRILRIFYGYSMIPHPVRHPELSNYKGTEKVRETSDMMGESSNESNETNDWRIKYIYIGLNG